MVGHQDENDFDVSGDNSIIDRMVCEISYIRVRVNTMATIKHLPITNTYFPNSLLSRLPIRDNYVVSSLIGSSGKVTGKRKGGRINRRF